MKKTKTQAFANLIGSLIFIAVGVWALIQTYSFQEVKNTYVQAAVFPQIMCVGMLIFAVILLIQSIIKLMTMDENDPLAEPAASINFIKDKGVLAALFVMLLCALFGGVISGIGSGLADGQHPDGTAAVPARSGRHDLRRRTYELEFTG